MRNSANFVNTILGIDIEEQDRPVSFSVVSPITRILIDEALAVIERRLQEDDKLLERTPIPAEDTHNLAELCVKITYFQYKNSYYEQIEGAAMSSPLSTIIANIYMEHFEKIALDTSSRQPKFWCRYVDDTFVIWPH